MLRFYGVGSFGLDSKHFENATFYVMVQLFYKINVSCLYSQDVFIFSPILYKFLNI